MIKTHCDFCGIEIIASPIMDIKNKTFVLNEYTIGVPSYRYDICKSCVDSLEETGRSS